MSDSQNNPTRKLAQNLFALLSYVWIVNYIKKNKNNGETPMSLREILTKLVENDTPILLNDANGDWEAKTLLETLPEPRLRRPAHLQSGLYIAEINDGGYLGRVLYKVKQK